MPVLNGLQSRVAFAPAPGAGNVPPAPPNLTGMDPAGNVPDIIDGTPVRVGVIALSAAMGLLALRMVGVRFSVGVSTR
jgi:hypothetical protein